MIYANGSRGDRGSTLATLAAIAALLLAPGCGPAGDGSRGGGRPDVSAEEPGPRHDGRVPRHGDAMTSSPNAAPLSLTTPDALPTALSWWGPTGLSAPPARAADFGGSYNTQVGSRLKGGAIDYAPLAPGSITIAARFQRVAGNNVFVLQWGSNAIFIQSTSSVPGGVAVVGRADHSGGATNVAVVAPAISATAWHSAVLVLDRDANLATLYLDGVAPTQYDFNDWGGIGRTIASSPFGLSADMYLGGASGNSSQYYGGLGQTSVWSRALTAAEAAAWHNGNRSLTRDGLAVAGLDSGLVRDWPLDDPATAAVASSRRESSGDASMALAAVNLAGGSVYPGATFGPPTQVSWSDPVGNRTLAKSGTSRPPALARSPDPRASFSGGDRLKAAGAALCGLDKWTAVITAKTPTAAPGSEACLIEEHDPSGATLRISIAPTTGYPRLSYRPAGGSLVTVDGDVNLCTGVSYQLDRRFALIVRRDGDTVSFRVRAADAGGGTVPGAAAGGSEATTVGYSEALGGAALGGDLFAVALFGDALDDATADGIAATACLMVNRWSGAAPFGTQISARWTADALGLDPAYLQDYEFLWRMGDPDSEAFNPGSYWNVTTPDGMPTWPADAPVGVNPSHVYEAAGDYAITLAILDRPYGADNAPQPRSLIASGIVGAVHVDDYSWTDIHVDATGGNNSNDGLTEATALKTEAAALKRLTDGVRLLFKRGETWVDGPDWSLSSLLGPVMVGAYGDPAAAPPRFLQQRIDYVEVPGGYQPSDKINLTSVSDLRLCDFTFEGNGWTDRRQGIGMAGGLNNLFLRLGLSDCGGHGMELTTQGLVTDGLYFDAIGPYNAFSFGSYQGWTRTLMRRIYNYESKNVDGVGNRPVDRVQVDDGSWLPGISAADGRRILTFRLASPNGDLQVGWRMEVDSSVHPDAARVDGCGGLPIVAINTDAVANDLISVDLLPRNPNGKTHNLAIADMAATAVTGNVRHLSEHNQHYLRIPGSVSTFVAGVAIFAPVSQGMDGITLQSGDSQQDDGCIVLSHSYSGYMPMSATTVITPHNGNTGLRNSLTDSCVFYHAPSVVTFTYGATLRNNLFDSMYLQMYINSIGGDPSTFNPPLGPCSEIREYGNQLYGAGAPEAIDYSGNALSGSGVPPEVMASGPRGGSGGPLDAGPSPLAAAVGADAVALTPTGWPSGGTMPRSSTWQRSSDGGATWADVAPGTTSRIDAGLAPGATYQYRLRVVDAAGATATTASAAVSLPAVGYTLDGPAAGAVGAASAPFTVAFPGAAPAKATTIVPTADGPGTFDPASLTLDADHLSGTFTFAPTAVGAVTIATTNDGGLADPSPLTYVATVTVTRRPPRWLPPRR